MLINELKQKIKEDLKKRGGEIRITKNAFGDGLPGVVEYVNPTESGTFTKYYGCKPLFRGCPDFDLTEQMSFGKELLSTIPREIIWPAWSFRLAIIWQILFNRKVFYKRIWIYSLILKRQLNKINALNPILNGYKQNEPTKEIKRALTVVLEKNGYKKIGDDEFYYEGNLLNAIDNFANFFVFFLEMDNEYRFPIQDLLGELDKKAVKDNPRKEIKRLLSIYLDRSKKVEGRNTRRFIYAEKMLSLLFLSTEFSRFLKEFLLELDIEKLKLSEDDLYFCLAKNYDFKGISAEERIRMKQKIDWENNHCYKDLFIKNDKGQFILDLRTNA